jgi:hypothetical protein
MPVENSGDVGRACASPPSMSAGAVRPSSVVLLSLSRRRIANESNNKLHGPARHSGSAKRARATPIWLVNGKLAVTTTLIGLWRLTGQWLLTAAAALRIRSLSIDSRTMKMRLALVRVGQRWLLRCGHCRCPRHDLREPAARWPWDAATHQVDEAAGPTAASSASN